MKTLPLMIALGVAGVSPRVMANGKPACGNTMSKGSSSSGARSPAIVACVAERRIEAQAARIGAGPVTSASLFAADDTIATLSVRLLPNGRPACGNTGGKSMEPARECSAIEIAEMIWDSPASVAVIVRAAAALPAAPVAIILAAGKP